MVRLKVDLLIMLNDMEEYFNSCMVRLKGSIRLPTLNRQSYFNSCMVRLKETATALNTCKLKFQFLYGTIKGVKIFKLLCLQRISIPVWYD